MDIDISFALINSSTNIAREILPITNSMDIGNMNRQVSLGRDDLSAVWAGMGKSASVFIEAR